MGNKIMKQITDEATQQINPKWLWKEKLDLPDEDQDAWKPYIEETSAEIEKVFQKNKKKVEIQKDENAYCIDFLAMTEYLNKDPQIKRKVRRVEEISEYIESEFYWYWQQDEDPFLDSVEKTWAPYDISINKFIEENFKKGILFFDIQIQNNVYSIDLKNNYQYLKKNNYHSRPIIRACKVEKIAVVRKNRFANIIESKDYIDCTMNSHEVGKNLQMKIKINELFNSNNSTIFTFEEDEAFCDINKFKISTYEKESPLFNTEICISSSLCNEMKKEFYRKVSFENEDEIIAYLEKEILKEAQSKVTLTKNMSQDKNKIKKDIKIINIPYSEDYKKQANEYIKILKNKNKPLEYRLIRIYTEEGFIVYSINAVLRKDTTFHCHLFLYFLLLQASIGLVSEKENKHHLRKALKGNEYKLYRGARIPKKALLSGNSLNKNLNRFLLFNEFMSSTYDKAVALRFLKMGKSNIDLYQVFYILNFKKEEVEKNRNLFCFVERISRFNESEVLISSSSIFQIKKIQEKKSYLIIEMDFISNGSNKFDFLKYCTLTTIDLSDNFLGNQGTISVADALKINSSTKELMLCGENNIGDEGAEAIAEMLKVNKSLKFINLHINDIGVEGGKALSKALQVNSTLEKINLTSNYIGEEGGKSFANALRHNFTLVDINFSYNSIGNESTKAIAEALKVNFALTHLNLNFNQIGEEGGAAVAEAIKVNGTLTYIDIGYNSIGDQGAKAFADALKVNSTLTDINLAQNSIGVEGAKALADTLKSKSILKSIDISNGNFSFNSIGNEGAQAIADALKVNSSLNHIKLNNNSITEEGAKAIADSLKINSTLTSISLSGGNRFSNKIGDEGAMSIANMLKINSTITNIDLHNNSIGVELEEMIADAIKVNLKNKAD